MLLFTELCKELDNHLRISLTRKRFSFQIGFLDLLVVDDGSVMYQKVILCLIEVRMGVRRRLPTASCPSSMADSYETTLVILQALRYDLFYTVFLLLNSILSNMSFDRVWSWRPAEAGNASTIVAPVLKELYTFSDHYFGIVRVRNNADDSAAFVFAIAEELR